MKTQAPKYIGAGVAVLASGWLLGAANGIYLTILDRARGWNFDLPTHPYALMATYLVGGLASTLVAAWLVMPPDVGGTSSR